jgi:hypothetical protein
MLSLVLAEDILAIRAAEAIEHTVLPLRPVLSSVVLTLSSRLPFESFATVSVENL